MSTPPASSSSLLGLPQELRDIIYGYVTTLNPQEGIEEPDSVDTSHLGAKYDMLHALRPTHLNLSWLNLISTCKTINTELQCLVDGRTRCTSPLHHTYILATSLTQGKLTSLSWERIPCAPQAARALLLRMNLDAQNLAQKGLFAVFPQLLQILQLFLFCGPRLDRDYAWDEPIRLPLLQIEVSVVSDTGEEVVHQAALVQAFEAVGKALHMMQDQGLFWGLVENASLSCGGLPTWWVFRGEGYSREEKLTLEEWSDVWRKMIGTSRFLLGDVVV